LESLIKEEFPIPDSDDGSDKGVTKKQIKKRQRKLLKKIKKSRVDENAKDGKVSTVLANIIKRRTEGDNPVEIILMLQEYFKIGLQYETPMPNMKYVISYMVRTHKSKEDVYTRVCAATTLEQLAKVNFNMFDKVILFRPLIWRNTTSNIRTRRTRTFPNHTFS
jgi:hypothetical protein